MSAKFMEDVVHLWIWYPLAGEGPPTFVEGTMVTLVLHCPYTYTYCMSRRNFCGGMHLRVR